MEDRGLNRGPSEAPEQAVNEEEEHRGRIVRRRASFFSPSPSPPPVGERDEKEFTEDNRHFSMLRQLQIADYITMLNCYCGFNSIISSARYIMHQNAMPVYVHRAMFFTILGFFFDVIDGRVARYMHKNSVMGKELDSLADLISFGVAPATIAFSLGIQTTADVLGLSFFVLCGLLRLARFNVTAAILSKEQNKVSHFEGVPIPSSLFLVFVMAIASKTGRIHSNILFGVYFEGTPFEFHLMMLIFVAMGCAMISKSLKLPKL